MALNAENADIGGHVFLRDGFGADGHVVFFGAHVGGGVSCRRGTFGTFQLGTAIVNGIFLWSAVQISPTTRVELKNASVGSVEDEEASWPEKGNLSLDGFTYGRISTGPTDAGTRLKWLDRVDNFTLQPYRQLARVLGETGDARGARQVFLEMEDRRRREKDRNQLARLWGWTLKWTIGYGQMSGRAVGWLMGLTLLGSIIFGCGYLAGSMAPNDKDAYTSSRSGDILRTTIPNSLLAFTLWSIPSRL
jgi:hypothetical protein